MLIAGPHFLHSITIHLSLRSNPARKRKRSQPRGAIPTQNSDQPRDSEKVTQGPLLGAVDVVLDVGEVKEPCSSPSELSFSVLCPVCATLEKDFASE